jgi:hypothetical protein
MQTDANSGERSSDLCVLRAHRVPEWRKIFVSMSRVRENAFFVEAAFHTVVSSCQVAERFKLTPNL